MRRDQEQKEKTGGISKTAVALLIVAILAGLIPARGIAMVAEEGTKEWSREEEIGGKLTEEWRESEETETETEEEWEIESEEGEEETTENEPGEAESSAEESSAAETSAAESRETETVETTEAETAGETIAAESTANETDAETSAAETAEEETTWEETTAAESSEAETTWKETTAAESSEAETTWAETTAAESSEAETTWAETIAAETATIEITVAETIAETEAIETAAVETTAAETGITETAATEAVLPDPGQKPEKPRKETKARSEEKPKPQPEPEAEAEPEQEAEAETEAEAEAEPVPEPVTEPESFEIRETTATPEATEEADRMAPEITLKGGGEELYRSNVPVGIRIQDAAPSAGIRKVEYTVTLAGSGKTLQSGVLYQAKQPSKTPSVDESHWSGSLEVETPELEGEVELQVLVTDWAGYQTSRGMSLKIDTRAPRVELLFDNRDARNGSFYNRERRATLQIREANFSSELVEVEQTGYYRGEELDAYELEWRDQGELHTAELVFSEDGDYSLSVEAEDLAGNITAGAATETFTIDTEAAELQIRGISDGEILGFDGTKSDPEAGIRLQFGDEHFAGFQVWLKRSRILPDPGDPTGISLEENEDVSEAFVSQTYGDTAQTVSIHIPERDEQGRSNDGLYRLEARVRDLAGNERREALSFSVNRFGSVYVFEPSLYGLSRDGGAYVQSVKQDLVLEEYNPGGLQRAEAVILRDTEEEERVLGTEDILNTEEYERPHAWHRYTYRLAPRHFARDGVYRIRVQSLDRAAHRSENEQQSGCEILFRVDSTSPELTDVKGMEHSQVNANRQEIRLEAFDAIGLKQVSALVNGEEVLRVEKFADPIRYSGSFFLGRGEAQQIRLILTDLAGNILDTEERDEQGNYVFLPAFAFERRVTVGRRGIWDALVSSFLPRGEEAEEETASSLPARENPHPEAAPAETSSKAGRSPVRMVIFISVGGAFGAAGYWLQKKRRRTP